MAREAKHTPGPWGYERITTSGIDKFAITAPHACMTASSPLATVSDVLGDGEPDARLIAAAPEMLEALRGLLNGDVRAIALGEAAIAKAEGK
ncbi:hypothetical protein [Paradevosia shaoguanensis]|uniref:hypothetical protein n=1 Tax=Paradevosia shaoguanensis TaxID=1335043 RepID=UPI001934733D|nr:hypothetical protein [Paradevosia shaoguanensis]